MKEEKPYYDTYYDIFAKHSLFLSRIMSFSKSFYYKEFPTHQIVFNSVVFTKEDGKVWQGDLDLTLDGDTLKKIAEEIGKTLYVVREMDGRFGAENLPIKEIIGKAIWTSEKGKIGE